MDVLVAVNIFWILSKNILEFSNLSFTLQFYLQYEDDPTSSREANEDFGTQSSLLYLDIYSTVLFGNNPADETTLIYK